VSAARPVLCLLSLVLVVMLPRPAWATTVYRDFCEVYSIDYIDGPVGDNLTGSTQAAHGVKFRFEGNTSGMAFSVISTGSGADAGCVFVGLDDAETWTVKVWRYAEIDGNTLKITNASHAIGVQTIATAYSPVAGADLVHTSGVSDIVNIMAAATYALKTTAGSLTGQVFEMHALECPSGGTCFYGDDAVWIHPDDGDEKFVILHELGHAIFDAANGWIYGGYGDDGADMDDCGDAGDAYTELSTGINSKEYQSMAAIEGLGDFYSALVINNPGTGECDYYDNDGDWDRSGSWNDLDPDEVPCDDRGVSYGSPTVDDQDYLGDFCIGTGTINNRGTEYDWMRMLWHMRVDHGLTITNAQELFVEAYPQTWTENGSGTGNAYPAGRFRVSAGTASWDVNFGTTWDDHDHLEGVHR
jgi:hypothetical protein